MIDEIKRKVLEDMIKHYPDLERINETFVGHTFEDVMREAVMTTLQGEVAGIIREMLNTATVKFGGNNNEISERSLGGKSHKERTTNEKKSRLSEE